MPRTDAFVGAVRPPFAHQTVVLNSVNLFEQDYSANRLGIEEKYTCGTKEAPNK